MGPNLNKSIVIRKLYFLSPNWISSWFTPLVVVCPVNTWCHFQLMFSARYFLWIETWLDPIRTNLGQPSAAKDACHHFKLVQAFVMHKWDFLETIFSLHCVIAFNASIYYWAFLHIYFSLQPSCSNEFCCCVALASEILWRREAHEKKCTIFRDFRGQFWAPKLARTKSIQRKTLQLSYWLTDRFVLNL